MIAKVINNQVIINKNKAMRYIELIKELEPLEKELKDEIKKLMEENNITTCYSNGIKMSFKNGYISHKFDTTTFKNEHPRLYKSFIKDTEVSSSIKLEV